MPNMMFSLKKRTSKDKNKKKEKRKDIVLVGLTVYDVDQLIKCLDEFKQIMAEQLSKGALESNQLAQAQAITKYKISDNLKTYFIERLEQHLNRPEDTAGGNEF